MLFPERFAILPLIAILRGVRPEEVLGIAGVLVDSGFSVIEVPLNSPEPLQSIRLLAEHFGARCLIGAGTVTSSEAVQAVAEAGGRLIVMPHSDAAVIGAAKQRGLVCAPGVATPTEAFAALQAGADVLKAFPAEQITPATLRAWRSVLPKTTGIYPVGGITPAGMQAYREAGASGFGLGSALYRPGQTPAAVKAAALAFAGAWT